MLQSSRKWIRSRRHRFSLPVVILLTLIVLLMMISILKILGNEIGCYRDHSLSSLPDISEDLDPPEPGNSIFFHETSCRSFNARRIIISGRQACAVESAALMHPKRKVYLLFTSPGDIEPGVGDESELALTALQTYGNIYLGHVDFARYINNTPLEHLYTSGSIELSKYAGSHASDVLRYLTLWKYGGVYLDLDVVVTKTFDDLGANFAGSESDENVAAGVLGLASDGPGHSWAQHCLDDLSSSFSGTEWGHNGPGVITRLLRRLCNAYKAIEMTSNCQGFLVLHPNVFYPIPWVDWAKYFDPKCMEDTMKQVRDSYAIHVWNKHSHATEVPKDSAYAVVARKYCPRVYKALEDSSF